MTTRVAYLTSRFPKLSETFIANEAVAVADDGAEVEIYAFVRESTSVVHPAAARLAGTATYPQLRSVISDQITWLSTDPRSYMRAWWRAVRGNIASPRFLLRAVIVTPIAASFALRMRERGTDHVHAHYATHSALGAYVIHLLTGLPYSFTAHAHDIQVDQTMLAEKVERAAATIAISEFNRCAITELVDPTVHDRIHVIRCGVDVNRFAPTSRGDHGATFRIAIVAALEVRKGHRILLEAVRQLLDEDLSDEDLPIVVDIVGDGPHRAGIASDVDELRLHDEVIFHGGLSAQDVAAVLRRADVFVLPSLTLPSGKMEGIPVALMEAMASGLPVIASDMSGIPELVIDARTGLLVAEGDVEGITRALRQLRRDPQLRHRLGRQGRAHVCRDFDQHRNAHRLRELFDRSTQLEPAPSAVRDNEVTS